MLFNSYSFLVFFVAVCSIYYLLPSWTLRKQLLLWSSYLFYSAWNPPFVLLLAFSTVLDWWIARRLHASEGARRRHWLWLSLAANLSLLGYFKYGDFLLDNLVILLSGAGVHYAPPTSDIILPVGISFYTFQSLSYTIDVYRRQLKADVGLADYALFVAFFPQLVAGPIVRASDFLPQLERPRSATVEQFGWGLVLVVLGLSLKVVLADSIFAPVVDTVYAQSRTAGALDGWIAVFAFSGQIYSDFCGYTLCAIGAALCFGFLLPQNFRQPYAAAGFSDFWRRWHISLSSWLRDYLYVPLGGNRDGEWRTLRNLMLTMLIGGLWHGASWLFVLWGGLHGACLVLERSWRRRWPESGGRANRIDWIPRLMTFVVVSLIWIPFRSEDWDELAAVVQALFRTAAPELLDPGPRLLALISMIGMLAWQLRYRDRALREILASWPPMAQAMFLGLSLIGLFLSSGGDERAFIYFQF